MKKFVQFASIVCASAMMFSATAFAEGETFKIGSIGPMTGAAATYGNAVMNAIQPVSYTHLDVYKRQIRLEGSCRAAAFSLPADSFADQFLLHFQ